MKFVLFFGNLRFACNSYIRVSPMTIGTLFVVYAKGCRKKEAGCKIIHEIYEGDIHLLV